MASSTSVSDTADMASFDLPEGWTAPTPALLEHAKAQTLKALDLRGDRPAQERLVWFYDIDGDYAGATFARLEPNERDRFTAADVTAASLLSVRVKAGAVRRMLTPGSHRDALNAALAALPDKTLGEVTGQDLEPMFDLHSQVKAILSGPHVANPSSWVVASKLCARKRPSLFPVRDREVCTYLGTISLESTGVDWLVFRHLVTDADVTAGLKALVDAVPAAAGERRVELDDEPLRLLDAALWTAAKAGL